MKKILQAINGVVLSALAALSVSAVEPTWNYAVQVSATVQESPAKITLTWPQDTQVTPSSYTVYRKSLGSTSWGGGTTLPGTATSYVDTGVASGAAYEYQIVKAAGGYTGYGYIYAGISAPLVDNRGKVVLIVDNTHASALSFELGRLQQDLAGDGWTVIRHDVSRNDTPANVKNLIKSVYNSDPGNVKCVFLFGHVPVPYSGNIVPDGHYPEHQGAWPADAYYGEMDGNWTDNSVYSTGAESPRNRNVPGDGKFDQSEMPSDIELQVGRVDLANMPGRKVWGGAPTFPSELDLLRNYLNKHHQFRHKRINPPAKACISDRFGVRGGESFSASGYRSFAPMVGANQIVSLEANGQWMPHLRDNHYLLAYGAGGGSYTSLSGLGSTGPYNDTTTIEIVEGDLKAVFTMLFGSWNGDWDAEDNIMRSVLATRTMGLACAWSGRPHWFFHHIGLGETLGYSARITQNNRNGGLYRTQINSAAGNIHVGLMGDPTLRLHAVAPPSNVSFSSGAVRWTASPDSVLGYHIYRGNNANGPFTRITGSPVTGTSFTDSASGNYVYLVKAVKLQTTASGTYYNTSQGISTSGTSSGGGDTTAPTVSITAPTANATVSGSATTFSANASDNVSVVGVQFKVDGSNLGPEDTTSPYSVSWNTTTIANDSHSLTAIARDAAGNQTTSTPVTVNVNNTTTVPPPVTGTPIVSVAATDNVAVEGFTDRATFTFTRVAGDLNSALTVNFQFTGTATKWNDYYRPVIGDMPESLVIPAGSATLAMTVEARPDTLVEGNETASLNIDNNAAYTVGTRSAVITISDTAGSPPPSDTTAPTIALTAPVGGSTLSGTQTISANASDNVGVSGVQFRVDGANLGAEDTSAPYSVSWNTTNVGNGSHTLTAIARDAAGNQTTSSALTVNVSNPIIVPPPVTGPPVVSVAATDNFAVEGFTDPATFTFTRVGDLTTALTVRFQFSGTATKWNDYRRRVEGDMPESFVIPAGSATASLTVHAWTDTLVEGNETATLSIDNNAAYTVGTRSATISIGDAGSSPPPPSTDTTPPTIALTAPSGGSAAVGAQITVSATASDNVGIAGVQFRFDGANLGAEDTAAPFSTMWNSAGASAGTHQLNAIARDAAGNRTTSATVSFTLTNAPGTQPAPTNSTITYWVDDSLPAGAIGSSMGGDSWKWINSNPAPFSGARAHNSDDASFLHSHWFDFASTPLAINTGDILVAHIYIKPSFPPTEIMLEWNDGSWEHRAFWGADQIARGTLGTASRRYMGALPAPGKWVRLEVPASQVGLEGRSVKGMSFALYGGAAAWDAIGKASSSAGGTTPPTTTTNTPPTTGTPVVSVAATDNAAVEGFTDRAVFTFTRTGDLSSALTLRFQFTGTATKWNDYYRPVTGDMPESLVIPAGSATGSMTVEARPDTLVEGNEIASLNIDNNSAYTVGTRSATITISDTGPTPTGGTTGGAGGSNSVPTDTNVVVTTNTSPPATTNSAPSSGTVVSVADNTALQMPKHGDHTLRILSPSVLELQLITKKDPDPALPPIWNFVDSTFQLSAPSPGEFTVTANGQTIPVQSVGFKRRPLYAPVNSRDLRLDNYLYLQLASPIAEGHAVEVRNPSGSIITSAMQFTNIASSLRYSPAIHVNQEGYVPAFPKQAMVGYYLGSAGELTIPTTGGFKIVDSQTGAQVFQGSLTPRPDIGYPSTPVPYQRVYEADFSAFRTPGEYRLVVPGLGASLPFLIDEGIMMDFTRTYALGVYHQRCGANNTLPFTRHEHGACHTAQADIPLPASSFQFTWTKIAEKSADYRDNPRHTAPQLRDEASQLYPIINRGKIDISRGHHDAGDYSKYTINSAGFLHHLMFAVDSFNGVAALDNLGLPESGDGISDVMQLAKWEADYLSKIQDADGGFYFLIYPRERAYENTVLPDQGDPQVVWPKTTAATAAAVAALAQTASSPRFRSTYPTEAAAYLAKAKLGWQFLINAINRYGKDGAYQKITHYGNSFMHDDELAWAAAELFVATGEAQYHQKLKEWFDPSSPATLHWGWWRLYEGYGAAVRAYAFAARSGRLSAGQLDSAYLAKCDQQIILAAEDHVRNSSENAYGSSFPVQTKRIFGAGWYFSTERAFDLAVGYQIDPRPSFLQAFICNLNYEGGCNPVNVSYITGLGWKRQREIVHQYAMNDHRVLPPSGIPQGNIQSSFAWLEHYKNELNNTCFPQADASTTGRYPMYDRWTDTFNVTTEFVNVDQARSLAGIAFFSTLTPAKSAAWKSATARILVPAEGGVGFPVTAILDVPGMDLNGARVVWEAKDHEPAYGRSTFTFTPKMFGNQWVEAEAQWPDGRRVFAKAPLYATNHLPIINVAATAPSASEAGPVPGSFTFTRRGSTADPLTVNYKFSGTATKWDDYRRSQGDIPEFITFPAGASSVTLTIVPVVDSKTEVNETVVLSVQTNAAYNIGNNASATVNISDTAVKISSIRRSPSTGEVTVTWHSQIGKLYQVNCKDNLAAPGWRTLQDNISATTTTTSYIDRSAASAPQRFYAIITSA